MMNKKYRNSTISGAQSEGQIFVNFFVWDFQGFLEWPLLYVILQRLDRGELPTNICPPVQSYFSQLNTSEMRWTLFSPFS